MLVSTPLALSIKTAYPDATVDYLVFAGTEGILANNPQVRTVHTIKPGERGLQTFVRLWRRYDYAIGSNPSDRTAMFVAGAGKRSIGFSYFAAKEWWKRLVLQTCTLCDDRVHIVPLILRQLADLGIQPQRRVVMSYTETERDAARQLLGERPYVILHPYTRRSCKEWPAAHWAELAALLTAQGVRPIFTVAPGGRDREVAAAITAAGVSASQFLPAALSFSALAAVIAGAKAFVGVDTVITHMAAALDLPTIALYGPTMTRHWGPWPNNWPDDVPYGSAGGLQQRGNITLVQQPWPCVPCNREECVISTCGQIECLSQLSAKEVSEHVARVVNA